MHGDEVLGTAPKGSQGFRPRTALLIAAILVAMVVVFQLGRDLGNESQAGGGDGSTAQAGSSESGAAKNDTPAEVPAAAKDKSSELDTTQPAKSSELTDDDRAFLDKDNNWTVIAISFDNNATGGRLALETYRYLREQGLPAVAPLTQGKFLTICVGAEATRNKAIEQIRERLRGLAGPPPRNEKGAFSSAYFANIEDQIDPKLRR